MYLSHCSYSDVLIFRVSYQNSHMVNSKGLGFLFCVVISLRAKAMNIFCMSAKMHLM